MVSRILMIETFVVYRVTVLEEVIEPAPEPDCDLCGRLAQLIALQDARSAAAGVNSSDPKEATP